MDKKNLTNGEEFSCQVFLYNSIYFLLALDGNGGGGGDDLF